MSAWSKILSPEERAEVEAGVVDAFIDSETGELRSTPEAKRRFVEFVRSAQQAGRAWADIMIEEWTEDGAGNFAVRLWKRRDAFTTTVDKTKRTRAMNRGTRTRDEEGRVRDVQQSLLTWSVDDLRDGIVAEAMREKESKINRVTYVRLLQLCEQVERNNVADALAAVGKTLEEFLAEKDEGAA